MALLSPQEPPEVNPRHVLPKAARKQDLLTECNELKTPPAEFKSLFCSRCRNASCVNAEGAENLWARRIRTQEDRLLINPARANPEEEKWRPWAQQPFQSLEGNAVEVWGTRAPAGFQGKGGQVHLAPPEKSHLPSDGYEEARALLRPEKGPDDPTLSSPSPGPLPAPEVRGAEGPVPESPRNPGPGPDLYNTPFPTEGVMVDSTRSPTTPRTPTDPWSIPRKPDGVVVGKGARVKMGG